MTNWKEIPQGKLTALGQATVKIFNSNNWICPDGDSASMKIEKDGGGLSVMCISGIPASSIFIDSVDFGMFWDKAGLSKIEKDDYDNQCFAIADYICSLFCEKC